jgi:hypothetical protein
LLKSWAFFGLGLGLGLYYINEKVGLRPDPPLEETGAMGREIESRYV